MYCDIMQAFTKYNIVQNMKFASKKTPYSFLVLRKILHNLRFLLLHLTSDLPDTKLAAILNLCYFYWIHPGQVSYTVENFYSINTVFS